MSLQTQHTAAEQKARCLRKLHALARERNLTHEDLRFFANAGYRVDSLTELTLPQLRDYIQRLSLSGVRRIENRESRVHPRGRRGPCPITEPQRDLIGKLRVQLDLSPEQLDAWIARHLADQPEHPAGLADILTSAQASRLITRLIGTTKSRQHAGKSRRTRYCDPGQEPLVEDRL